MKLYLAVGSNISYAVIVHKQAKKLKMDTNVLVSYAEFKSDKKIRQLHNAVNKRRNNE